MHAAPVGRGQAVLGHHAAPHLRMGRHTPHELGSGAGYPRTLLFATSPPSRAGMCVPAEGWHVWYVSRTRRP